jgi:hypothetical protein
LVSIETSTGQILCIKKRAVVLRFVAALSLGYQEADSLHEQKLSDRTSIGRTR